MIKPNIAQSILLYCALSIFSVTAYTQQNNAPRIEVYDKSAFKIINEFASVETLGEGYSWSEGPVWVGDGGYLLFSDVPENKVYKYKEGEGVTEYLAPSGSTNIYADAGTQGSNGLLINGEGKLVLMQHGDRRISTYDLNTIGLDNDKPKYESLVSHYQGKRLNSPNDAVFDSQGNLYFTDPPYGLSGGMNDPAKELDFQGIFKLSPKGELSLIDDSVSYPNGIILSNDEQSLIVAVSDPKKLEWIKFTKNSVGKFTHKKSFYDVSDLVDKKGHEGYPDGMVLHSSGNFFATGPGGVWLFSPKGKVLARIFTGRKTANCTLSGDEKTLFMTAHDQLLALALR
ncbi:SMP-30/gluconolactonase/LRE family protein [Glaciecola petra]|uniref:SMP-30/gluconolactonase/LRE family protein n=1 Tax=Glaciecola petra TaxID=3075602 RepID=A0ABU2ZPN9_9ALTE|nr:SMP-30/gluconolactonase/LRE family protein [Aestuariibacter sp. P117]MDT0594582.1 SMP-30/gluconolactonase/LRE family protein [Aestuariibacter sp. P117]